MSYRLVCLDAGFTLMRPRDTMAGRLAAVLREHGHTPDDEDLRLAWDAADAWFWEDYHRPGNTTWTSDERIDATWRSYHRLMIDRLGFPDDDQRVLESVLASQLAPEAWKPYEDTIEALEELTRGRPPGSPGRPRVTVISDWGSALDDILEAVGVRRYLDDVLASAAVGLAKPQAEFYRLACDRAVVPPAEAVMIGDSLRADVLGARAAGMDAILLDRDGATADLPSDLPRDVPVARSLLEAVGLAAAGPVSRRSDEPERHA